MVSNSMRHIPAAAQDEIRRRAIVALGNGFKQVEVSRLLSLPERTIRRWVALMRAQGVEQLEPKRRGRRAGEASALGVRQMKRIETMVVGRMPDQLRLPFYLWTREAVAALIEREYGLKLTPASIGNYLKRWGMSPQKPVRRAYERNDEAITRWLETDYPAIAANAKRQRALIYWADECGVRSDDVRGRSFALKGHTPEIRTTGQRFGCNMISAVSNRGALAFQVFEGRFVTQTFIDFLQRLVKHGKGKKIALIVDGHPVHKAVLVRQWIAEQKGAITLYFLPGYAPELNPDELLNHDLKLGLAKRRPRNRVELKSAVRSHLHKRQKQPHVVKNFFKAKHVQYAA